MYKGTVLRFLIKKVSASFNLMEVERICSFISTKLKVDSYKQVIMLNMKLRMGAKVLKLQVLK